MRLCFVNAFVFTKVFVFKGRFTLKNSSVNPTTRVEQCRGSLSLLHFYKQGRGGSGREGGAGGVFSPLQEGQARWTTQRPPGGRRSEVPSTSVWWDGGLGHCQLLGEVVEASDVVHAALAHHAGELRVHLRATREPSVYDSNHSGLRASGHQ